MKIYDEIILNWNYKTNQFETIYEDSYEYNGEVIQLAQYQNIKNLCECDNRETCNWLYGGTTGDWVCTGGSGCSSNINDITGGNNIGTCYSVEDESIWGCTNELALNYDLNAILDDGSCIFEDTSGADASASRDPCTGTCQPQEDHCGFKICVGPSDCATPNDRGYCYGQMYDTDWNICNGGPEQQTCGDDDTPAFCVCADGGEQKCWNDSVNWRYNGYGTRFDSTGLCINGTGGEDHTGAGDHPIHEYDCSGTCIPFDVPEGGEFPNDPMLNTIKCFGGINHGSACQSDMDCPGIPSAGYPTDMPDAVKTAHTYNDSNRVTKFPGNIIKRNDNRPISPFASHPALSSRGTCNMCMCIVGSGIEGGAGLSEYNHDAIVGQWGEDDNYQCFSPYVREAMSGGSSGTGISAGGDYIGVWVALEARTQSSPDGEKSWVSPVDLTWTTPNSEDLQGFQGTENLYEDGGDSDTGWCNACRIWPSCGGQNLSGSDVGFFISVLDICGTGYCNWEVWSGLEGNTDYPWYTQQSGQSQCTNCAPLFMTLTYDAGDSWGPQKMGPFMTSTGIEYPHGDNWVTANGGCLRGPFSDPWGANGNFFGNCGDYYACLPQNYTQGSAEFIIDPVCNPDTGWCNNTSENAGFHPSVIEGSDGYGLSMAGTPCSKQTPYFEQIDYVVEADDGGWSRTPICADAAACADITTANITKVEGKKWLLRAYAKDANNHYYEGGIWNYQHFPTIELKSSTGCAHTTIIACGTAGGSGEGETCFDSVFCLDVGGVTCSTGTAVDSDTGWYCDVSSFNTSAVATLDGLNGTSNKLVSGTSIYEFDLNSDYTNFHSYGDTAVVQQAILSAVDDTTLLSTDITLTIITTDVNDPVTIASPVDGAVYSIDENSSLTIALQAQDTEWDGDTNIQGVYDPDGWTLTCTANCPDGWEGMVEIIDNGEENWPDFKFTPTPSTAGDGPGFCTTSLSESASNQDCIQEDDVKFKFEVADNRSSASAEITIEVVQKEVWNCRDPWSDDYEYTATQDTNPSYCTYTACVHPAAKNYMVQTKWNNCNDEGGDDCPPGCEGCENNKGCGFDDVLSSDDGDYCNVITSDYWCQNRSISFLLQMTYCEANGYDDGECRITPDDSCVFDFRSSFDSVTTGHSFIGPLTFADPIDAGSKHGTSVTLSPHLHICQINPIGADWTYVDYGSTADDMDKFSGQSPHFIYGLDLFSSPVYAAFFEWTGGSLENSTTYEDCLYDYTCTTTLDEVSYWYVVNTNNNLTAPAGVTILDPWDKFCEPFNETINDHFTVSTYFKFTNPSSLGGGDTVVHGDNDNYNTATHNTTTIDPIRLDNTGICVDEDGGDMDLEDWESCYQGGYFWDLGCNNFNLIQNSDAFWGNEITLTIFEPYSSADFSKVTNQFCATEACLVAIDLLSGDGPYYNLSECISCEPDIIFERYYAGELDGRVDATSGYTQTFQNSYHTSEWKCQLKILLFDPEGQVDIWFNGTKIADNLSVPWTGGPQGGAQVDYDALKWMFTSGFDGISEAMCQPGTNTITVSGTGGDWTDGVWIEYIKVEVIEDVGSSNTPPCGGGVQCGVRGSAGSYKAIGWSMVYDNSIDSIYAAENVDFWSTALAQGHVFEDRSLTEAGLISYDYRMSIKPPNLPVADCDADSSCNILYLGEQIDHVALFGDTGELSDILNSWEGSYDNVTGKYTGEFQVVGDRNAINECCTLNAEDITCVKGLQTRFRILNWDYIDKVTGVVCPGPDFTDCGRFVGVDSATGNYPSPYDTGQSEFPAFYYFSVSYPTVEVMTTPLQFCATDELLTNAGAGFGSTTYNTVFSGENGGVTDISDARAYNGMNDPTTFWVDSFDVAPHTTLKLKLSRHFGAIPFLDDGIPDPPDVQAQITYRELNPIDVNIIDANKPKIHEIIISEQSMNPMVGVQNNDIVVYFNLNKNIVDVSYQDYVHPVSGDTNESPDDGIYSIGSIDFSTYEIKEAAGDMSVSITLTIDPSQPEVPISNKFPVQALPNDDGEMDHIWHSAVKAINSHPSPYTAEFDIYSNPDRSSSIKRILIRAQKVGSEYNGILGWDLSDMYYIGDKQDLFNNLIGGRTYPILHLYEDFGYIFLDLKASDVDPLSTVEFQVISSNKDAIYPSYEDNFNLVINPVGDSISVGGTSDVPNLETESQELGAGESIATQTIKLQSQDLGGAGTQINVDTGELLIPNFRGEVDLAIRAIDNNAMSDLYLIRIKVHPVNDPPVIEYISDTEIYINNPLYPNDMNIEIKTMDVEQTSEALTVGEVREVDLDYCAEIDKMITEIDALGDGYFVYYYQVMAELFTFAKLDDSVVGSVTVADCTSYFTGKYGFNGSTAADLCSELDVTAGVGIGYNPDGDTDSDWYVSLDSAGIDTTGLQILYTTYSAEEPIASPDWEAGETFGTNGFWMPGSDCNNIMFCTAACYQKAVKFSTDDGDWNPPKWDMEYSCSFANFNNDSTIDAFDYSKCQSTVNEIPVGERVSMSLVEFRNEDTLPNFLNHDLKDEFIETVTGGSGTENVIKNYVYYVPQFNRVGTNIVRISVMDNGRNEDNSLSQIRTGFSTASITVGGVDTTGPTGSLISLEKASFGLITDTYQYFARGDDPGDDYRNQLNRDFEITVYPYWDKKNKEQDACGLFPASDAGVINEFGECCSSNPETGIDFKRFFNINKSHTDSSKAGYYYYQEFKDELDLFSRYFSPHLNESEWCNSVITDDDITWEYTGNVESKNTDGYYAPNQRSGVNELDHTVSYMIRIQDLVENYDEVPTPLPDWWNDFDNSDWVDKWETLAELGWKTTGERTEDHPYGISDSIVYTGGPFTEIADNLRKIIYDGIIYRFGYPSIYKVSVYSNDTYGFQGETKEIVDARNIIPFDQTVLEKFDPTQGMNVIKRNIFNYANGVVYGSYVSSSKNHIEARDLDKRPSLGLWNYGELNRTENWTVKHSDSYKSYPGNFTSSFFDPMDYPGLAGHIHRKYFLSEKVNFLNHSGYFNNLNFQTTAYWEFTNNIICPELTGSNCPERPTELSTNPGATGVWTNSKLPIKTGVDFSALDNLIKMIGVSREITVTTSTYDVGDIILFVGGKSAAWEILQNNIADLEIDDFYMCGMAYDSSCMLMVGGLTNQGYDTCNNLSNYQHPGQWGGIAEFTIYANQAMCESKCVLKAPTDIPANCTLYEKQDCVPVYNAPDYSYNCTMVDAYKCNLTQIEGYSSHDDCMNHCLETYPYGDYSTWSAPKNPSPYDTISEYCTSIGNFTDEQINLIGNLPSSANNFGIKQTITDVDVISITDVDWIFSIYLKKGSADFSTVEIEIVIYDELVAAPNSDGQDKIYKKSKTIEWSQIQYQIDSMGYIIEYPDGTCDEETWLCDGGDFTGQPCTGEDDCTHEQHPTYYGSKINMWFADDLGEGWYKFSLRLSPDELDVDGIKILGIHDDVDGHSQNGKLRSISSILYPGGDIEGGSGTVYVWGAQLEKVEMHNDILSPYQPTEIPGYAGLYDFIPDVDVRNPLSLSEDGEFTVLYKYYDEELRPEAYKETSAPLVAQLYFYIRDPYQRGEFVSRDFTTYIPGTLYIGFVDWGDGSPIEYDKEPFVLADTTTLQHIYKKSGIYEIRGEMFNVALDKDYIIHGIGYFKEFILRINVGINKEIEGEFILLGGEGYDFVPYENTSPVISGISKKSSYYKSLKRQLGWIGETVPGEKPELLTHFKYYGDRLRTEIALSKIDQNYIGETMSHWTGSLATGAYGVSNSTLVDIGESSTVTASIAPRGFYSGSWSEDTGELSDDGVPKLINKGIGIYFEELGDYLGDVDIAQNRYLNKPFDMWEMLGFSEFKTSGTRITSNGISRQCNSCLNGNTQCPELDDTACCDGSEGGTTYCSDAWDYTGSPTQDLIFEISYGYTNGLNTGNWFINHSGAYSSWDDLSYVRDLLLQSPLGETNNGEITFGNMIMFETNYGNKFSSEGANYTYSDYSSVDHYLEFYNLDYSIHFIGKRVFTGSPFDDDNDGLFEIVYCYECNGQYGTGLNLRANINLEDMEELESFLHPGNPISKKYYKNIIPKGYNIYKRSGIDYEGWEPGDNCGLPPVKILFCTDDFVDEEGHWGEAGGYAWNFMFPDSSYLFPTYQIITRDMLNPNLCPEQTDDFWYWCSPGDDLDGDGTCDDYGEWSQTYPCAGCFEFGQLPLLWASDDYEVKVKSLSTSGGIGVMVYYHGTNPGACYRDHIFPSSQCTIGEMNPDFDDFGVETSAEFNIPADDVRYADDCGMCQLPYCEYGEFNEFWLNNPCETGKTPTNVTWNTVCDPQL